MIYTFSGSDGEQELYSDNELYFHFPSFSKQSANFKGDWSYF